MRTISISMQQVNKLGKITFSTSFNTVLVENTDQLSEKLSTFLRKTVDYYNTRKRLHLPESSTGIKKSGRFTFSIVSEGKNLTVSLKDMGKTVEMLSDIQLTTYINQTLKYYSEIAELFNVE